MTEVLCTKYSTPSPLVCLFPTFIYVRLSVLDLIPHCGFPWVTVLFLCVIVRVQFHHIFHRFLLVPFSATAIQPADSPVFNPHLSKKKQYSVNLLSWLHGLNCLPTSEWQQMITSYILFAVRKGKKSADINIWINILIEATYPEESLERQASCFLLCV